MPIDLTETGLLILPSVLYAAPILRLLFFLGACVAHSGGKAASRPGFAGPRSKVGDFAKSAGASPSTPFGLCESPWIESLGNSFFLHDGVLGLRQLNRWAGRFELYLGWLRDLAVTAGGLWFLGRKIFGWTVLGISFSWPLDVWRLAFGVLFLALAAYARWWRWHGLGPLHEFARLNPRAHPTEFFNHLYGRLGALPHRVPVMTSRKIDPAHLDFREGKAPRKSFWLLLHGAYDSYLFATLAYYCFRWRGAHYIKTAGSGLSLIWASRLAQLGRMEVIVERSPELEKSKKDRHIFAISHKSFFDFCLAPLVYLKENADGSAANFTPRIMVAKDHFKDNPILYKLIGFGRMLEAWGMIFIDRKSKTEGKAQAAVGLAVKKLLASDMSFSLYPQGTRAYGQLWRDGTRWDAGYFCVGKAARLKKEMGHLKKGVAYIAVDTALGLLQHKLAGPIWVIPVSMEGPGTACPRNSLKVQTGTKIVIKLGDPICITPEVFRSLKDFSQQEVADQPLYRREVSAVLSAVDAALQKLLDVPTRLERRFFLDLRDILDPRGADEVAVALKAWRAEDHIVYVILDCIYCLPMPQWRGFLVELANVLRHHGERGDLEVLRNKVAECF